MKVIRVDDLKSFCLSNEIFQSSLDGQLIVKIGETDRGDDKYELLIDHVPIVDAKESDWIPCSERLPEKFERVLAYYDESNGKYDGDIIMAYYSPRDNKWYEGYDDEEVVLFDAVKKWMPLPELPKEGEQE